MDQKEKRLFRAIIADRDVFKLIHNESPLHHGVSFDSAVMFALRIEAIAHRCKVDITARRSLFSAFSCFKLKSSSSKRLLVS
ncbi:hypothetical protein DQ393_28950 [Rhizobium tropici]|uniref:Uncharacterized protein n=1 Tax=Rhizobium tropici TaxID=398 RepID=A0A329YCB4_RHITR|nr:hypothetical protein DQ393_28950 [Rhizobium tropici]